MFYDPRNTALRLGLEPSSEGLVKPKQIRRPAMTPVPDPLHRFSRLLAVVGIGSSAPKLLLERLRCGGGLCGAWVLERRNKGLAT
jgi:hypothetical protein